MFGFFLSPYLDPTFHRALQCSPSKHSFGVFGITFALMIVITCLYQGTILTMLSLLLGLHLALQTIFTIGAHMKEGLRIEAGKRKPFFIALLAIACLIAVGIAHRSGGVSPTSNWLPGWQDDYLRFFVFYGFIFPGLVAIFMLAGKTFTPLRVTLFTFVALFSLPLLEVGYIGSQEWLSVLPVVVLLTWVFADRSKTA
jgi:hypothetical protein